MSDFIPAAVDEMRIDGKLYGLSSIYGGRLIYYNKALFKAAGQVDPYELFLKGKWDFDQYVSAAKAMTRFDPSTKLPTQIGAYLDNIDIYWIIWGFGGDVLTRDGKFLVDQREAVRGLEFLADLEHKHHVLPMPSQAGLAAYNFESGNVAMWPDWVGAALRFRGTCTFDWDIVPIPAGPAGRVALAGGNATVMSHVTSHRKEAWELMKFLSSVEAEEKFCGDTYRRSVPTRLSVAKSDTFLKSTRPPFNTGAYLPLYGNTRPFPVTARWNEWQSDFSRWMERLMTDDPARRYSPQAVGEGMARDSRTSMNRQEDQ